MESRLELLFRVQRPHCPGLAQSHRSPQWPGAGEYPSTMAPAIPHLSKAVGFWRLDVNQTQHMTHISEDCS